MQNEGIYHCFFLELGTTSSVHYSSSNKQAGIALCENQ